VLAGGADGTERRVEPRNQRQRQHELRGGVELERVAQPVPAAGGPDYIRVIRDPLPDIPMLAAGGTHLGNVGPFLDAGCVAVGLGASLADPALAAAGRFDEIEARARAFVELIAKRRAGSPA
jgi:2-keto-3-deoxy-6-phosphogluconate aldolase